MDSIKAFFAKDWVKVVLGGLLAIAAGLVAIFVADPNQKATYLAIIAGIGSFLGITSGGTSSLRSNVSNDQTATLQNKGVLPPG